LRAEFSRGEVARHRFEECAFRCGRQRICFAFVVVGLKQRRLLFANLLHRDRVGAGFCHPGPAEFCGPRISGAFKVDQCYELNWHSVSLSIPPYAVLAVASRGSVKKVASNL
jgi:hypothetical protein